MILDMDVIESLRELDAPENNLLKQLVEVFTKEGAEHVSVMKKALGQNNAAEVKRMAHSLKSASANLGAVTLSGLCLQLEQNATISTELNAQVNAIEEAYQLAITELQKLG